MVDIEKEIDKKVEAGNNKVSSFRDELFRDENITAVAWRKDDADGEIRNFSITRFDPFDKRKRYQDIRLYSSEQIQALISAGKACLEKVDGN